MLAVINQTSVNVSGQQQAANLKGQRARFAVTRVVLIWGSIEEYLLCVFAVLYVLEDT